MLRSTALMGVVFHLLGFQIHVAVADSVPRLNVGQSCASAERGAVVSGRGKDKEACMSDERDAQDQTAKTWSQYTPADKTVCVGMNRTGGPASYVELVSCLEVMRDARKIHNVLTGPLLDKQDQLNARRSAATGLDEGNSSTDGSPKSAPQTKTTASGGAQ
jgi:hypothetical protein